MAPPPFWRMTFVDNVIYNTGANMIFWGNTHDIVVDGNTISDGIGMMFWSIRSVVGLMVDDDANLIERDNTCQNVSHPVV